MRLLKVFLSLLILVGCQPSESVPLATDPDSSARPVDQGVQDVLIIEDMKFPDVAPPMDAGIPDYVIDVPPETLPTPSEYALIGGGDESWFVWWRGGRLLGRRFSIRLAAAEGSSLGPIDPDRVSIETSDIVTIGYAPPYEGRLEGARAPNTENGHPGWFFVPSATGELNAYNLARPAGEPMPLGVTTPFMAGSMSAGAESEDIVSIVGNQEGETVYQILRGQAGLSLVPNTTGYPVPVSMTSTGNRWVYAFDDGNCAVLLNSSSGPAGSIGTWPCNTGPGTRIIGRGALGEASPGLYAVGQTADAFVAWDIRPGTVANPGPIHVPDVVSSPPSMEDAGVDGGADAGPDSDAGVTDGGLDDGVLDAGQQADAAMEPPAIPNGVLRIFDTTEPLQWLNRIPDGEVALVEGTVVLMNRWSIRTLADGEGIPLAAILGTGDVPFVINWDAESGQPIANRAAILDSMNPPELSDDRCPGRLPETCGSDDLDCDGYSKANLCCQAEVGYENPEFPSKEELVGDFFITLSDIGTLGLIRYADRIELRSLPEENSNTTGYGCWSHTTALTHIANQSTTIVMAGSVQATPMGPSTCPEGIISISPDSVDAPADAGVADGGVQDAGSSDAGDAGLDSDASQDASVDPEPTGSRPVLMWHTGVNRLRYTDAPCASIRHLELYRDQVGHRILVFCDDARYEYTLVNHEISEPASTAYEFGSARWIGPPVKRTEGNQSVTYLLAASSESADLHLIRVSYERVEPNGNLDDVQHNITVTESAPADQNLAVPVEFRDLPFRPSIEANIYPVRIQDEKYLEVFKPGLGWSRAISHRWPIRSYLSAHDDFAITVTEQQDPTTAGFDSINQNILGFVHDLRTTGNHWGREFPLKRNNQSTSLRAINYGGLSIPNFGRNKNKWMVWLATGGTTSNKRLEGQWMYCRGQEE